MLQYISACEAEARDIVLRRRGFEYGCVRQGGRPAMPDVATLLQCWQSDKPVMLPAVLDVSARASDIEQSLQLMRQVLVSGELSEALEQPPYKARLATHFPLVASSFEEHDEQGIEKVYFDAELAAATGEERDCVAEDLWCKASWLSFLEADASLRFRFSFGMECLEDVAADPERQRWAGKLCDALFPESALLTENGYILHVLSELLEGEPAFVERIVYFNAPNGGAQMHHDVERGHNGVVFAQLSGSTFWLALAKPLLMDELILFVRDVANHKEIEQLLPDVAARGELQALLAERQALADYMEAFDHELVEAVIDRSAGFTRQLIEHGHGFILQAGDVLLMPQRDIDHCVWHAVTSLGDEPGEALSFAVRKGG